MKEALDIKIFHSISIADDEWFPYMVDIFNGCFGKEYESKYSCRKKTFYNLGDGHMAWFPKMATIKNGERKPPSRAKGWINYLKDDGFTLIQEKEDDTRSGNADGEGGLPRYTFGWYADKGYVFLGVFQAVKEKCRTGHFEFVRIADSIDLRKYHTDDGKIKLPSSKEVRVNENADDAYVREFRHSKLSDVDDGFEYAGHPQEVKKPVIRDGIKVYPRDRKTAINAIAHAGYTCEIDKRHPTFVRKNSDKTYTEPHHLIPMAFQHQFDVSLDVEENIVSLCSNCHNEIHYGHDADTLIRILYSERKEFLEKAGIVISMSDMLTMYGYKDD